MPDAAPDHTACYVFLALAITGTTLVLIGAVAYRRGEARWMAATADQAKRADKAERSAGHLQTIVNRYVVDLSNLRREADATRAELERTDRQVMALRCERMRELEWAGQPLTN